MRTHQEGERARERESEKEEKERECVCERESTRVMLVGRRRYLPSLRTKLSIMRSSTGPDSMLSNDPAAPEPRKWLILFQARDMFVVGWEYL